MTKQAPKHIALGIKHNGSWEQQIEVSTGKKYFSWDSKYFDGREKAEAHKRKLIQDHKVAGVPGWFKTWGVRVFKTQHGWGVFAQV